MTEEMCGAAGQKDVLASERGCIVYFYFYIFQGGERMERDEWNLMATRKGGEGLSRVGWVSSLGG